MAQQFMGNYSRLFITPSRPVWKTSRIFINLKFRRLSKKIN